ncbi:MAG: hypothetical protein IMF05_00080 [Proteobacteria bacterium]|nr:hypothetical protein [Pseudomonadota bacterium]
MRGLDILLRWSLTGAAVLAIAACAQQPPKELTMVDHIKAGLIEQDVFVEKEPGKIYRISPDEFDAYKNAPIFAASTSAHHHPFNGEHNGPYEKGAPLDMTMAQWLSATGAVTYQCNAGKSDVTAHYKNLVPNAVYTMWYAYTAKGFMGCKDCPFATIDFPVGPSDGSGSVFRTDASGSGTITASMERCVESDDPHLMAMFAIAYHSDGNTYGPSPGPVGSVSHVQLFAGLPE